MSIFLMQSPYWLSFIDVVLWTFMAVSPWDPNDEDDSFDDEDLAGGNIGYEPTDDSEDNVW